MTRILKSLVGKVFGKLTVKSFVGLALTKKCSSLWLCKCDCGNEKIVNRIYLRSNETQSCGCIVATQNGLSKKEKRTYDVWRNMIRRCYDSKSDMYYWYGKRGIRVCDRWKNSFLNFFNDMGRSPKNHQIDRINNNGNYEPQNCRWVTCAQNNLNRRNNRILTAFDKSQTIKEWSLEIGFPSNIIRQRIDREKWSIEKALTTVPVKTKPPIKKRKNYVAMV